MKQEHLPFKNVSYWADVYSESIQKSIEITGEINPQSLVKFLTNIKDIITNTEEYFETQDEEVFQLLVDLFNLTFVLMISLNSSLLDIYTITRIFKKPEGGNRSSLTFAYFGDDHVKNIVKVLVETKKYKLVKSLKNRDDTQDNISVSPIVNRCLVFPFSLNLSDEVRNYNLGSYGITINGTTVKFLSGSKFFYYLKPNLSTINSTEIKYFPLIVIFGNADEQEGSCAICSCSNKDDTCCYSVLDEEFQRLLDNLGDKEYIVNKFRSIEKVLQHNEDLIEMQLCKLINLLCDIFESLIIEEYDEVYSKIARFNELLLRSEFKKLKNFISLLKTFSDRKYNNVINLNSEKFVKTFFAMMTEGNSFITKNITIKQDYIPFKDINYWSNMYKTQIESASVDFDGKDLFQLLPNIDDVIMNIDVYVNDYDKFKTSYNIWWETLKKLKIILCNPLLTINTLLLQFLKKTPNGKNVGLSVGYFYNNQNSENLVNMLLQTGKYKLMQSIQNEEFDKCLQVSFSLNLDNEVAEYKKLKSTKIVTPKNDSSGILPNSLPKTEVSVSPKRGSVTPKRGSVTPKRGSVTPKRGSVTPKKGSVTPKKGSVTPKKGSVTPKKGSLPKTGSPNTSISP